MKNSPRFLALLLALVMLCLSMPALAAEPEYLLPKNKLAADYFTGKPIDLTGELTHNGKKVTAIKLSSSKINLIVGQAYRVKLFVKGTGDLPNFNNTEFTMSPLRLIEQVDVVDTFSQSALFFEIIGVRPGKTKLTVSLEGKKASANVTIKNRANGSLRLSSSTLSLLAGETAQLDAFAYPGTFPASVSWKSANKKIATVSSSGRVVAKKKGTVTLTAKRGSYTAKCVVRVETKPTPMNHFRFSVYENSFAMVDKYNGSAAHVIIPETYNGYPVCVISNSAFMGNKKLKSVVLPSTTLGVFSRAFENCSYLQTVVMPDEVIIISENAFKNCERLRDIAIPSAIKDADLSLGAFYGCSMLEEAILPNGLREIPAEVFAFNYKLSNVSIPSTVEKINDEAFANCFTLRNITIPASVTQIGAGAFFKCTLLESITIPDRVATINTQTFTSCHSLRTVKIGTGVRSIGYAAFAFCDNLSSITIPANVTSIDPSAFLFSTTNLTIYGYRYSYAETFATERNIRFVAL